MVNGVLVERTVDDVLPSLKTNADGLRQVLEEMLKQYKSKQTEMDNWKVGLHTSTRKITDDGRYRKRTTSKSCSHNETIRQMKFMQFAHRGHCSRLYHMLRDRG
jgi:hypothetical protein